MNGSHSVLEAAVAGFAKGVVLALFFSVVAGLRWLFLKLRGPVRSKSRLSFEEMVDGLTALIADPNTAPELREKAERQLAEVNKRRAI